MVYGHLSSGDLLNLPPDLVIGRLSRSQMQEKFPSFMEAFDLTKSGIRKLDHLSKICVGMTHIIQDVCIHIRKYGDPKAYIEKLQWRRHLRHHERDPAGLMYLKDPREWKGVSTEVENCDKCDNRPAQLQQIEKALSLKPVDASDTSHLDLLSTALQGLSHTRVTVIECQYKTIGSAKDRFKSDAAFLESTYKRAIPKILREALHRANFSLCVKSSIKGEGEKGYFLDQDYCRPRSVRTVTFAPSASCPEICEDFEHRLVSMIDNNTLSLSAIVYFTSSTQPDHGYTVWRGPGSASIYPGLSKALPSRAKPIPFWGPGRF